MSSRRTRTPSLPPSNPQLPSDTEGNRALSPSPCLPLPPLLSSHDLLFAQKACSKITAVWRPSLLPDLLVSRSWRNSLPAWRILNVPKPGHAPSLYPHPLILRTLRDSHPAWASGFILIAPRLQACLVPSRVAHRSGSSRCVTKPKESVLLAVTGPYCHHHAAGHAPDVPPPLLIATRTG